MQYPRGDRRGGRGGRRPVHGVRLFNSPPTPAEEASPSPADQPAQQAGQESPTTPQPAPPPTEADDAAATGSETQPPSSQESPVDPHGGQVYHRRTEAPHEGQPSSSTQVPPDVADGTWVLDDQGRKLIAPDGDS